MKLAVSLKYAFKHTGWSEITGFESESDFWCPPNRWVENKINLNENPINYKEED